MLRFLRYLNRLRMGQKPLFVEYDYDFRPRWTDGGNPFIREIIARHQSRIDENLRSLGICCHWSPTSRETRPRLRG